MDIDDVFHPKVKTKDFLEIIQPLTFALTDHEDRITKLQKRVEELEKELEKRK